MVQAQLPPQLCSRWTPLASAMSSSEPGARVTVVLLDGAAASLPAGALVERLGPDLDYNALLDLIFESDHVVTW